ncbi:unnamed protein product [Ectocarpus sp. 12 AP-2014]
MEGSKTCCGYPRKRVLFCAVPTMLAIMAGVIVLVVLLLRNPDDIETQERTESDSTTAEELSILKTATLSSSEVSGTVSLLSVAADNSFFLALNDFVVNEACDEAEIRLQEAGFTSGTTSGVVVVPLTADTASAVELDFTELLDEDFEAELYDQVALWCGEAQLGDAVDLVTPTTVGDGGPLLLREAVMSGTSSYTVEGMVQIIGSGSIVDDALITTYSLRFQDIEVSSGPDVFLYLTADFDDPEDVDSEGSLRVELDGAERGTFSFTGNFTDAVPEGFVSPEDYAAAVVWCDQFSVFFGSGLFEDVA